MDTIKNNTRSFSNPLSDILQDSGDFRKCDDAFEGHTDNIENFDTTTGTTTLDEAENLGKAPFDSQESLAEKVVASGGVKLVSEMKVWGKKNTVTLHPKEECQCPSTATC